MKHSKKTIGAVILTLISLFQYLNATQVTDYVDKSKCDQIVDMQLYQICYSYKYKGALSGWVTLDGKLLAGEGIKKRPKFYGEPTIPMKYRTKPADYKGFGDDWNRGHFIVADADLDYDIKALNKAYTMANIIPQSAPMNQKTWTKVEKYGRILAQKLGTINSISIARYDNPNQMIGNNIVIPTKIYRIYYNNDAKFEKCFEYENRLDINWKNDNLRDHEINCKNIRLK